MSDPRPIDDGGPAHPCGSGDMRDHTGISLRQWYAGQALAGCLSTWDKAESVHYQSLARIMFEIADAMIAHERGERGQ